MERAKYLLRAFDCTKYHIEYGGFLSNHLAHGLLVLGDMNMPESKLDSFCEFYVAKHLEPPEPSTISSIDSLEQALSLREQRRDFSALLEFYQKAINSEGYEPLCRNALPTLMYGLQGSILHALIHTGYGIYGMKKGFDCDNIVAEGLAYMTHSYEESDLGQQGLVADPVEDPLAVLAEIKADTALYEKQHAIATSEPLASWVKKGVQRHVKACTQCDGAIAAYADRIAAPKVPYENPGASALALALTVNGMANRNDFFLLHGVTSAFAFYHIMPYLTPEVQQIMLRVYIRMLVAVYLSQNSPTLETPANNPGKIENWDEIHSFLEGMVDEKETEHVYKLVHVCKWVSEKMPDLVPDTILKSNVNQVTSGPLNFSKA